MTNEKPPLLTDKQIDEAIFSIYKRRSLKGWFSGDPELRAIAQAQLDADWEYYKAKEGWMTKADKVGEKLEGHAI